MFKKGFSMSASILIITCTLVFYFISCAPPFEDGVRETKEPGLTEEEEIILREKCEDAISILSESVAQSVTEDNTMLSIIHEELGKRFDGDTEVLLETVLNRMTDDGRKVSEIVSRSVETTVSRRGGTRGTEDEANLDEIVWGLEQIMNLQIYMPEFDAWDGASVPLVGFIPFTYDVETEGYITAYDASGNEYRIDETNYLEHPLFVIGPNERTDAAGNIHEEYIDITNESLAGAADNSEMLTRGDDVTPGREGATEVMDYFEIWNEHEGLFKGSAEIRIVFMNDKYHKKLRYNNVKSHSRNNNDLALFNWFRTIHGPATRFVIYENDGPDTEYEPGKRSGSPSRSATLLTGDGGDGGGDSKWWEDVIKYIKIAAELFNIGKTVFNFGSGDETLNDGYILYTDTPKEYVKSSECVLGMTYILADPPPATPTPTPHPGVYELVVMYNDANGAFQRDIHPGLEENSTVNISTAQTYKTTANDGTVTTYTFSYWYLRGGEAVIADKNARSTTVGSFKSDASVAAIYTSNSRKVYKLIINYMNASGAGQNKTESGLTESSTVSISTAASYTSGGSKFTFTSWELSGNAVIVSPNAANTTVRNITSDSTVTAKYKKETTATTYTLSVIHTGLNGQQGTIRHTNLTESSIVSVSTAESYTASDGTKWKFVRWNISGSVSLDNASAWATTARNIKADSTLTAEYTATYRLDVTSLDSSGTSHTVTYTDLTNTSVISISTVSSFEAPGSGGHRIYFVQWWLSGNAVIDSVTSTSTSVRNFKGNASVSVQYQ
ncbi:MAG: hypothetical protein JW881_06625 [Spirochaetales bacterium]|nr:hypothetical protein [Spirochaetales bacterium]